jgi:glycerate-2-kinase
LGTDGADNGEYAGAIVEKAPTHAIAIAQEYLLRNDSTTFFEKHAPSSLLKTGLTGTNVADLFIVLAKS